MLGLARNLRRLQRSSKNPTCSTGGQLRTNYECGGLLGLARNLRRLQRSTPNQLRRDGSCHRKACVFKGTAKTDGYGLNTVCLYHHAFSAYAQEPLEQLQRRTNERPRMQQQAGSLPPPGSSLETCRSTNPCSVAGPRLTHFCLRCFSARSGFDVWHRARVRATSSGMASTEGTLSAGSRTVPQGPCLLRQQQVQH